MPDDLPDDMKRLIHASVTEASVLFEDAKEQAATMMAAEPDKYHAGMIMVLLWECCTDHLRANGWSTADLIAKLVGEDK